MDLKKITLKCIRKNINRFNHAYSISQDDVLRGNLEFLRQKFTPELLYEMTDEGAQVLHRKYFEFLLNEYLEELNTSIIHPQNWGDAIIILSDIGKKLETVTFEPNPLVRFEETEFKSPAAESPDYVKDFIHEVLPYMPFLKKLKLKDFKLCNETMNIIGKCCLVLKDLILQHCDITDQMLLNLLRTWSDRVNLRSLSVKQNKKCHLGVAFVLHHINSLEEVDYYEMDSVFFIKHRTGFLKNALDEVPKYNLTKLELNGPILPSRYYNMTLCIVAALCPHLKELKVRGLRTKEHMQSLARFRNLVDVELVCCKGVRLSVDEFLVSCGNTLETLHLSLCKLQVPLLLRCCPKLQNLILMKVVCVDFPEETRCSESLSRLTTVMVTKSFDSAKSLRLLLNSCPDLDELVFNEFKFEAPCCHPNLTGDTIDRVVQDLILSKESKTRPKLGFHQCRFNCSSRHLLKAIKNKHKEIYVHRDFGMWKGRRARVKELKLMFKSMDSGNPSLGLDE